MSRLHVFTFPLAPDYSGAASALPPHRTHVMVFAPGRPSAQSNKPRRFVTEPPERFVTGL